MPITLAHRATRLTTLQARHGAEVVVIDVTSKGQEPWVRCSPFFPHGDIPVPFSPGAAGVSVEGIWQGLKVFEREGIDRTVIARTTMKNLKRGQTVARGNTLGHQQGLEGTALLGYLEARRAIYLPCYRWVLEHRLQKQIAELRRLSAAGAVVLLDYQTNDNIEDLSSPLSHAALIKHYLENVWPEETSDSAP